jgi:PIN domain nuclease of toxin-antitoxin system
VNVLLDTHMIYWVLAEPEKLHPRHLAMIETSNQRFVSAVSAWEIATKVRLGKWLGAAPLLPDILSKIEAAGFEPLPLTFSQAERAGSLDLSHRDPFDRMLAAQALDLDLRVVTVDPAFRLLGCKVA